MRNPFEWFMAGISLIIATLLMVGILLDRPAFGAEYHPDRDGPLVVGVCDSPEAALSAVRNAHINPPTSDCRRIDPVPVAGFERRGAVEFWGEPGVTPGGYVARAATYSNEAGLEFYMLVVLPQQSSNLRPLAPLANLAPLAPLSMIGGSPAGLILALCSDEEGAADLQSQLAMDGEDGLLPPSCQLIRSVLPGDLLDRLEVYSRWVDWEGDEWTTFYAPAEGVYLLFLHFPLNSASIAI